MTYKLSLENLHEPSYGRIDGGVCLGGGGLFDNMNQENYSKREMDEQFKDIKESLDRIEIQTTRHNGRLSVVEKWMYTMSGAIVIMGFLLGTRLLTL